MMHFSAVFGNEEEDEDDIYMAQTV